MARQRLNEILKSPLRCRRNQKPTQSPEVPAPRAQAVQAGGRLGVVPRGSDRNVLERRSGPPVRAWRPSRCPGKTELTKKTRKPPAKTFGKDSRFSRAQKQRGGRRPGKAEGRSAGPASSCSRAGCAEMGADAEPASASAAEVTPWPDVAASVAPPRPSASTPDTVNSSMGFGSSGAVTAGVWQLGSAGWRTLPGGRLDPPSRGPSTKLRLASFDAPAPASEATASPERKAEPASPRREVPASPKEDAPRQPQPVQPPKPRVVPLRAAQPQPADPPPRVVLPVRPIVCQQCNCKNSRCLKQYCVCFARGGLCGPECACVNCANNNEDREEVPGPFSLPNFSPLPCAPACPRAELPAAPGPTAPQGNVAARPESFGRARGPLCRSLYKPARSTSSGRAPRRCPGRRE